MEKGFKPIRTSIEVHKRIKILQAQKELKSANEVLKYLLDQHDKIA